MLVFHGQRWLLPSFNVIKYLKNLPVGRLKILNNFCSFLYIFIKSSSTQVLKKRLSLKFHSILHACIWMIDIFILKKGKMHVEEVIYLAFNIEIRTFSFRGKKYNLIWRSHGKIDSIPILKYEYMPVVRFLDIFRFKD